MQVARSFRGVAPQKTLTQLATRVRHATRKVQSTKKALDTAKAALARAKKDDEDRNDKEEMAMLQKKVATAKAAHARSTRRLSAVRKAAKKVRLCKYVCV
jgi:hypothetical protein